MLFPYEDTAAPVVGEVEPDTGGYQVRIEDPDSFRGWFDDETRLYEDHAPDLIKIDGRVAVNLRRIGPGSGVPYDSVYGDRTFRDLTADQCMNTTGPCQGEHWFRLGPLAPGAPSAAGLGRGGQPDDGHHHDRLTGSGAAAPTIVPAMEFTRQDTIRLLDSYASLLVLLLVNFFLLELVDDPRWGALGSTLLAAVALVVAISDPEAGHTLKTGHWVLVGACVALAPIVFIFDSAEVIGLTYLLPVAILVSRRCRSRCSRVLHHKRVTHETVLGALCSYVLVGLLFAFLYLAVEALRDGPFFAQPGQHVAVGVRLLQLRHADDARLRRPVAVGRAAAGADGARGPAGNGVSGHARRAARHALGAPERRARALARGELDQPLALVLHGLRRLRGTAARRAPARARPCGSATRRGRSRPRGARRA